MNPLFSQSIRHSQVTWIELIKLGGLPICHRRGIAVANAGSAFSVDVADYAVGLLLDVLRRISTADSYASRGLWPVQGEFPLGHKVSRSSPFSLLTIFLI
uniref:Uncharacterized protein n=1 Tax=Nelumbo nucifera TaxID=4432 RepID=A0A822YGI8_NELNU|nr:TPA_asm: hypothetical protein HUJ06_030066 [Nelumbo nucifera]